MNWKLILIYILIIIPYIGQSQGYRIEDYQIDLTIAEDGQVDVHEIITVFFKEERRGIMRDIPNRIRYEKESRKVTLSNVEVKDQPYKILNESGKKVIRIGDAEIYLTGRKVYDIRYTLSNFLLYNDHNIEFQYNLISDWDTSIENLSYTIALPTNLDLSANDYRVVRGADGTQNYDTTYSKEYRRIMGKSLKPIAAKENVTAFINLPVDYIDKPPPPVPLYKKDKWWAVPLSLLLGIILYFRSLRSGNSNVLESRIAHFPPQDFSPAMVGAYYDNKVHTEDIISLLPYWANLGYIKILKGVEDLFFKKLKPLDNSFPDYQKNLFDNIFSQDNIVMLEDLNEKMYGHVYKSKSLISKELLGRNLYDDKEYKVFHNGLSAMIGVLVMIAGIMSIVIKGLVLTGIIGIIAGVTLIVIHFVKPKKSEKGMRIQSQLEGLKSFLQSGTDNNIEDVLRRHPDYFEKIYPYAIAFGIDKTWIDKMKDFNVGTPQWYAYETSSANQVSPSYSDFSKDFNVQKIKSVFTSAPASSSGSGSSGGGFSGSAGGGFGGGGSSW